MSVTGFFIYILFPLTIENLLNAEDVQYHRAADEEKFYSRSFINIVEAERRHIQRSLRIDSDFIFVSMFGARFRLYFVM